MAASWAALVAVPGLGECCDWQAQPGEPGMIISWEPFAADQARGMASLMTIQLQGYVAADKNGLVNKNDPNFLSTRFKQVVAKKPVATASDSGV